MVSYHVVIEGTCWTGIEGGRPVQLRQGDVVVYPRGHAYSLSHDRQPLSAAADAKQLVTLLQGGVSAGSATIVHIQVRPPSVQGGPRVFITGDLATTAAAH